jgi:hypothetical protein
MADGRVSKQDFREAVQEFEHRVTEKMQGFKTEILHAFEVHMNAINTQLGKLEVDHSTLDIAISGRLEVVERRLFEIEKRLGMAS